MATLMVTLLILLALGILTHFVPGTQKGRVGRPSGMHASTKDRTMKVPGMQIYARPSSSVRSGQTTIEIGGGSHPKSSSCSVT